MTQCRHSADLRMGEAGPAARDQRNPRRWRLWPELPGHGRRGPTHLPTGTGTRVHATAARMIILMWTCA